MIFIKGLLCILFLFIIPIILGKFLSRKDEKPELIYDFIFGHIIEMGAFFVLALPLILLRANFSTLVNSYLVLILILTILSIIINRKKFNFKFQKPQFSIFKIIFFVLLLIQLFIKIEYSNINNDDSSFVTLSTSMIETNKMYLTDGNGNETTEMSARRSLNPISAYYATISELLDIHVTIVTHTIIPIVFICLAYCVYYCLAKKFLKGDSIFIFLSILCFLNLFAFSVKGYNRYLILYTWFGRAILAGIILPLLWAICLDAMNSTCNKFLDWLRIFIAVLAGSLCSGMAVPLISISIMAIAIISSIRDKKISYIFKVLLCILPCIIVGILYLILK